MKKYVSALLLCLSIARFGYSSTGQEDSVTVHNDLIYYYNAVADSNDECQANKVKYEKALVEADSVIRNRGRIIVSLSKQNQQADLQIEQKDVVVNSLKADLSGVKTQRTFLGAVVAVLIAFQFIK